MAHHVALARGQGKQRHPLLVTQQPASRHLTLPVEGRDATAASPSNEGQAGISSMMTAKAGAEDA